jgi:hypothetical protein
MKEIFEYWNNRYLNGGNSGSGSYGVNASYKADIINEYIINYDIKTIFDHGCGDGNQASLFIGFDKYIGYDISSYVIEQCKCKFLDNPKMNFCLSIDEVPESDLCISFDVLYHLIDENDFEKYLYQLFNKSKNYVVIFSTNHNNNEKTAEHIYHRIFTSYIKKQFKNFKLIKKIENPLKNNANLYLYRKNKNIMNYFKKIKK